MVLVPLKGRTVEPIEAARLAVEVASDKMASDVVLMDLRGLATFTDFFVICSADSKRQISAIARALGDALEPEGLRLHHRVGKDESGWVLMDFGDVVVHIFDREMRDHFDLEAAWPKARALVRIQ